MKKEDELKDLQDFADKIGKIGGAPKLSRSDKKRILSEIIPTKNIFLRFAPVMFASFFVGLLISYPFVSASNAGDVLYGVKRGVEDIRSFIQPSYDNELLKVREAEIKELESEKAEKTKIEETKKVKKQIEDRIKSREFGSEKSDQKSRPMSVPTKRVEGERTESEHQTTTQTSTQQSSGSNSPGSGTQTVDHNALRDACREALDTRKEAGENIKSDQYKACDNL